MFPRPKSPIPISLGTSSRRSTARAAVAGRRSVGRPLFLATCNLQAVREAGTNVSEERIAAVASITARGGLPFDMRRMHSNVHITSIDHSPVPIITVFCACAVRWLRSHQMHGARSGAASPIRTRYEFRGDARGAQGGEGEGASGCTVWALHVIAVNAKQHEKAQQPKDTDLQQLCFYF
jgi:hypothetical protein